MNIEEAKMRCLGLSGGDVGIAKQMFEWVYPPAKPMTLVKSDLVAEMELRQAMTVGRIATPVALTDMDGVQWQYLGQPTGWAKVD